MKQYIGEGCTVLRGEAESNLKYPDTESNLRERVLGEVERIALLLCQEK